MMLVRTELQTENCKLKKEKCGKATVSNDRQFAICDLKFAFCNVRTVRRGLSLTEVLISMAILTLGLLGVASVFPVGSFYMQKAEISDKASAIAQSVMGDIMARGMLNPRSWYVMIPNPRDGNPASAAWNTGFSVDGQSSPSGIQAGTFTRPFAAALTEALNQPKAATDRTLLARQFGTAFVIDPLGISTMAFRDASKVPSASTWSHGPADVFPASAYQDGYWYTQGTNVWAPWLGTGQQSYLWPIRRVTFRQPTTGWQMDATMATHYFQGNDDLSYDFPARDDRPAVQTWDTTTANGNTIPLARKWAGDYSWIVTVVPTTNAARDGMATNPEGFSYDVSVVVFHKRALPDNADTTYAAL